MLFILHFIFQLCLHYIHLQDHHLSLTYFCIIYNKFKKKKRQPVKKNMGKNIKSYATTQIHSPGEGREALRQITQIFRLQM